MIDDLLQTADELATRDRGRPREVSLRRAVSSAYYAIFHALAATIALDLLRPGADDETFAAMWRSMDHGADRRILLAPRSESEIGPGLSSVGLIFARLQEARYRADYDPRPFPFTGRETIELIAEARQAVDQIRALDTATKLRFAARLVTKQR